jgi:hypothetical protein
MLYIIQAALSAFQNPEAEQYSGKSMNSAHWETQGLASCHLLGRAVKHSEPWFLPLQNGENNIYFAGLGNVGRNNTLGTMLGTS